MSETEIIENIKKIQAEIDAISEDTKKKVMGIEKKYSTQLKTEYEKRDVMICKSGVPMFWSTVMSRGLIDMFDTFDQQVVEYIDSVSASSDFSDEQVHKKITFKFKENPFFTNKELSRTVSMNNKDPNAEFIVTPAKIDWKPEAEKKDKPQNNANKKRKEQSSVKENSFLLNSLQTTEDDVEWMEEIMRMYQDPFSILVDDDEDEEGGFNFDEGDEVEEEEEVVKPKSQKKK